MINLSKMKRNALILTLFLVYGICTAQEGIIDIHPAGDPSGKLLSMEDVILSRDVYPENNYCRWTGPLTYSYREGDSWKDETLPGDAGAEKPARPRVIPRDGGLYVAFGDDTYTVAVPEREGIVYGTSVSRNEFGINGGTFLSPDCTKLAFYRKDESQVTDFPLLDITTRTGDLKNIKYPMNGMTSEKITLGVFRFFGAETVWMDVDDFGEDRYLTNITWSPDSKYIFIQVVDRSQHHMKLNQYDASDGSFIRTILTEDDPCWIEPLDPLYFIQGHNDVFLYRTDNRDGYRNLYLADTEGNIRRLTCTDADVEYISNDGTYVYYTSAEVSPVENHLFRIKLQFPRRSRKSAVIAAKVSYPERLTFERGWHNISMNESSTWFIDSYSNLNLPRKVVLRPTSPKQKEKVLLEAADPLEGRACCEVDFGTVPSADGLFDNYYRLIKPLGFDPSKKYPVVVYVYGGPHSQMVQDTWLGQIRMWEMLMAQKGYIVYVQDNRGTQNRGADFEKAINRRCGQAEMADQMMGIAMLKRQPWVDADRIGVHGWSYGGFMTISLMTNYPETFKVGVAGGPVIDWKWYEIMYGERYMDTEETNPEGFAETSLIGKAPNLKGKLLICQGAIDNTVVWEHSLSFVSACISNNVQLDYFPYPLAEHNVFGKDRVHLMDKVTMYFEDYL